MEIVYVIMLVFMTGFFCVVSFWLGTMNQTMRKPKETKQEREETKKRKEEFNLKQRQFSTMMGNIDTYNGTSLGQKDIPRE